MDKEKLQEILEKHRKWLNDEEGGERADLHGSDLHGSDLSGAELHGSDLSGADLRYAALRDANLSGADLRYAALRDADLRGADLRGADLSGANLRDADLYGADLYKSVLPLWCGGLKWKLDRLQMAQLAYHFCSMECEDDEVKALQKSLYAFANEFADSRFDLRDKKYQA